MGTIAEEISALRGRISQAYDVIDQKGGDVPFDRTSWNLSASIESIRTGGEPEDVNGISSLYAVIPEVMSNGLLSGTHRTGPYMKDMSKMTYLSGFNTCLANNVGNYALYFVNRYSSYSDADHELYSHALPNISCVNLSGLKHIDAYRSFAMQGFAGGNWNLLSVNLDTLSGIYGGYQLDRAFRSTLVPCDLPNVEVISGSYCCQYAWHNVDAYSNPLQVQERHLPKLKTLWGDYSMAYAFYQYKPNTPMALNLSALTSITGQYAFDHTFAGCQFTDVIIGANNLTSNYVMTYAFINHGIALSSVRFPNLKYINASYGFTGTFQGASITNFDDTFPVLSAIGTTNTTNYPYVFQYAWNNASGTSSVTFPELTRIGTNCQYTFYRAVHSDTSGASSWPVLDLKFPKLTTFRQGAYTNTPFRDMNGQSTAGSRRRWRLHLNALQTLTAGTAANQSTFYQNRGMTDIYLASLSAITNNFMFSNCSELTGIHFGAANEAAIKATSGWSTLWGRGAGAATVYFDL